MIDVHSLWVYGGTAVGIVVYAIRSRRWGLGLRFPFLHAVLLIIGLLAGGRAFHLVAYPDQLPVGAWDKFASLVSPRNGFVIYGGIIGATLAHLLCCRIGSLRAAAIADLITPSVLLVVAFGRVGCHFRGCCFGAASESVLSVTYRNESIPFAHYVASGIIDPLLHDCISVYPTQLMYATTALAVAAIGMAGFRVRPRNFSISALALCLTSLAGIAIHQLRGDPRGLSVTVNVLFVACSLPFVVFSWMYPTSPSPEIRRHIDGRNIA